MTIGALFYDHAISFGRLLRMYAGSVCLSILGDEVELLWKLKNPKKMGVIFFALNRYGAVFTNIVALIGEFIPNLDDTVCNFDIIPTPH
jgi:hypothetical protein